MPCPFGWCWFARSACSGRSTPGSVGGPRTRFARVQRSTPTTSLCSSSGRCRALVSRPDVRLALLGANLAAAIGYAPWLPTLLKDTRSPGNLTIGIIESSPPPAVSDGALSRALVNRPSIPAGRGAPRSCRGRDLGRRSRGSRARVARRGGWPRRCSRPSSRTGAGSRRPWPHRRQSRCTARLAAPFWEPRNLIDGWPALALMVGAVMTAPRFLRLAAVILVIVVYVIGAAEMLKPSNQRPDYNSAVRFIDRAGPTGAPVIELPGPTPGPLTELDAAFALAGRSHGGRHQVLRLGFPSLQALERARPYALVSPTAPADVMRQAAGLARDRALFVVVLRPAIPSSRCAPQAATRALPSR